MSTRNDKKRQAPEETINDDYWENQFCAEISKKMFSGVDVTIKEQSQLCEILMEYLISKEKKLKEKTPPEEWNCSLWGCDIMLLMTDTMGNSFEQLAKNYHFLLKSGLNKKEMGCVFSILQMLYDQNFALFNYLGNAKKEDQKEHPLLNAEMWIEYLKEICDCAILAENLKLNYLKYGSEVCPNPACKTIEGFYEQIQSTEFSDYLKKKIKLK